MLSDQELIQGLVRGEKKAITFLIDNYTDYVYHLAVKTIRDRHDAEEITNDVLMKVIKKIGQLEEGTNLKAWMYSITYRQCLDYIRRKKNHADLDTVSSEDWQENTWADAGLHRDDTNRMVEKLLDSLSHEDAMLLRLYYLEECKIKEVAEITGLSEENIKTRLFRSRKLLSQKLSLIK